MSVDITAKYIFTKWVPEKKRPKKADKPSRRGSAYVRFSGNSMYISIDMLMMQCGMWQRSSSGRHSVTAKMNACMIHEIPDLRFDMLVDRQERMFAIKFHADGEFVTKTIPGQVSMTKFIREMEPTDKPITMRFHVLNGEELWIGGLCYDET